MRIACQKMPKEAKIKTLARHRKLQDGYEAKILNRVNRKRKSIARVDNEDDNKRLATCNNLEQKGVWTNDNMYNANGTYEKHVTRQRAYGSS